MQHLLKGPDGARGLPEQLGALQGEDEQSMPAAPQESSKGSQGVLVQAS